MHVHCPGHPEPDEDSVPKKKTQSKTEQTVAARSRFIGYIFIITKIALPESEARNLAATYLN